MLKLECPNSVCFVPYSVDHILPPCDVMLSLDIMIVADGIMLQF